MCNKFPVSSNPHNVLRSSKHSEGPCSNLGAGLVMKTRQKRGSIDYRYASLTFEDQISKLDAHANTTMRRLEKHQEFVLDLRGSV